mgnify:CR=1 FL=1
MMLLHKDNLKLEDLKLRAAVLDNQLVCQEREAITQLLIALEERRLVWKVNKSPILMHE